MSEGTSSIDARVDEILAKRSAPGSRGTPLSVVNEMSANYSRGDVLRLHKIAKELETAIREDNPGEAYTAQTKMADFFEERGEDAETAQEKAEQAASDIVESVHATAGVSLRT